MVNYRRIQLEGVSYFFTVNLQNRRASVLTEHIGLLRESFVEMRKQYPFTVEAVVILPEHLHTIWTLPPGDVHYPTRWQSLKSLFTRKLKNSGANLSKNTKGEHDLWQRRYWEHVIRDDMDMQRHIDYVHYNPVKHGLVNHVKDWPYSSFHRYVRRGLIELHWGVGFNEDVNLKFGE